MWFKRKKMRAYFQNSSDCTDVVWRGGTSSMRCKEWTWKSSNLQQQSFQRLRQVHDRKYLSVGKRDKTRGPPPTPQNKHVFIDHQFNRTATGKQSQINNYVKLWGKKNENEISVFFFTTVHTVIIKVKYFVR